MGPRLKCSSCGREWISSNTYIDIRVVGMGDNSKAIVEGCVCGGTAPVIPPMGDGLYNVNESGFMVKVRDVVRQAAQYNPEVLSRVVTDLRSAQATGDANALRAAVAASPFAWSLNTQANRMELSTHVAALVAVLTLILAWMTRNPQASQLPEPEVERMCRTVITEIQRDPKTGVAIREREEVREERVGRNDACPCASGMKFKRCHGAHPSISGNPKD